MHHAADDADTIWIYEACVSKAYHDDVHESYPEIRAVLDAVPRHVREGSLELLAGNILISR